MISIAGLTLTTLPPFSQLFRKRQQPQLEQRIEKQIFDERLSSAIRNELEKAAQLLPTEPTHRFEEEIADAEWEESTITATTESEPEPLLEPLLVHHQ